MEKAREATDLANIRSAYAEVQAAALTEETTGNATVTGSGSTLKASETIKLKQQKSGWQTSGDLPANLEEASGAAEPTGTLNQEVKVEYDASTGKTTINLKKPTTKSTSESGS